MGINGISSMFSSAIDKVALNPQPLPPKALSGTASLLDKVALNPQPLPPKSSRFLDDYCGNTPKPGPWPHFDLGSFLKSRAIR